jgi:hypothetical protein
MTGNQSQDLANVNALVANAKRLGLEWSIRPATVGSVGNAGNRVLAVYDGDSVYIAMISLVSKFLAAGDRIMAIAVPPAANYIIGVLDLIPLAYGYMDQKILTTSGTFNPTNYPGIKAIRVRVVGGGGAGGGAAITAASQSSAGAGGQAGGYAESFILTSVQGNTETVTVGVGGTGVTGAAGGAGGTSSFATSVVADGGAGGVTAAANVAVGATDGGGAGHTVTGDIVTQGAGGGSGVRLGLAGMGGHGGSSVMGGGAWAKGGSAAGVAGRGPGGGGSGASNAQSQAVTRIGGAGADGIVIVDVYG